MDSKVYAALGPYALHLLSSMLLFTKILLQINLKVNVNGFQNEVKRSKMANIKSIVYPELLPMASCVCCWFVCFTTSNERKFPE